MDSVGRVPDDAKSFRWDLPVILGHDYQHVMARAEFSRNEEGAPVITITGSSGAEGHILAEYLEQPEIVGLSFIALPVRNANERKTI